MAELKIAIAQTTIQRDVAANTQIMLDMIAACEPCNILVFSEGMLSGYFPEEDDFLSNLSVEMFDESLQKLGEASAATSIDIIFGTAYPLDGKWHNTAIWLNGTEQRTIYSKCNLARLDRGLFEFGDTLKPVDWYGTPVGIQLCREINFPEQWLYLKLQGAQVIFHLNNNQSGYRTWEFVLQTRAYENQIFIVSVNPSHPNQRLFSYVIDPNGQYLLQTDEPGIYYQTLDLSQVHNSFIDQRRTDLLQLIDATDKRV